MSTLTDIEKLWCDANAVKKELLIKRYKDEHDETAEPSYLELTQYYILILETKISDIQELVKDDIL